MLISCVWFVLAGLIHTNLSAYGAFVSKTSTTQMNGNLRMFDFKGILNKLNPFDRSKKGEEKQKIMKKDPEVDMTVPEIINYCGYQSEIHRVVTEDGYILELHRIQGRNGTSSSATPIFLQHGVLGSSADWVINPCKECLPFLLADKGFDVWLGNIRGNRYSREHTKLSPKQKQFWKFSWDEMATYDLPTMLDYVIDRTNVASIRYVGHSMGTTIMFALLASKPEYNNKIHSFFALGPVAQIKYTTSPIKLFAPQAAQFKFILELVGTGEFLPSTNFMKFLGETFCRYIPKIACQSVIYVAFGYDPYQSNTTRLPVYVAHCPAGTSLQTLVHFAQVINTGAFQRFDYGAEINMEKYGQLCPPVYDLSKVQAPTYLFWGENDLLADPDDVRELASKLPNVVYNEPVPYKHFNHLDFTWAMNARTVLYEPLIKMLE